MSEIQFNLRVYGLLVNEKEEILLSDECRFGHFFTKFPGGGIEFGEGIIDTLKREFKEELNAEVTEASFLYVNDFFQGSKFQEDQQIISFYYLLKVASHDFLGLEKYTTPFYSTGEKNRWAAIESLTERDMSFPIDKKALLALKDKYCTVS
jgi:ADP-ribose pyrophosphatase YjhB (NUDIX family)